MAALGLAVRKLSTTNSVLLSLPEILHLPTHKHSPGTHLARPMRPPTVWCAASFCRWRFPSRGRTMRKEMSRRALVGLGVEGRFRFGSLTSTGWFEFAAGVPLVLSRSAIERL